MKKALASVLLFQLSMIGFAQNSVGIGTNSPTAQLHTTATVRFQGLTSNVGPTRVLVSDVNGYLFYREASMLQIDSNNWHSSGNAGINPAVNFLGTTDYKDLSISTNSIEKIRVLANGNVGIGTSAPTGLLHVHNTKAISQINVTGKSPTIVFYDLIDPSFYGRIGFATGPNDFAFGSKYGDFVIGSAHPSSSLLFTTSNNGINNYERGRFSGVGYFGISTQAPTAKLHIQCDPVFGQSNPSNIRFENLQSGTGNILVIDANGYVYRAASTASKMTNNSTSSEIEKLQLELVATKNELEILKNKVDELESRIH